MLEVVFERKTKLRLLARRYISTHGGEHMQSNPVAIIILLIAGVLFLLLAVFIQRIIRPLDIKRTVQEYEEYMKDTEERLARVKPYILDYFNTLHSGHDNSLEIMNRIIAAINLRIQQIKDLMSQGGSIALNQARQLLKSPIELNDGNLNTPFVAEESLRSISPSAWEPTIEALFQGIGQKLADASISVAAYRRPMRKRKSTITALLEAGIKGLSDLTRKSD